MSDDLGGPKAANPTGEASESILRPDFDRRVMLQFRGSLVTSDAGLLAYRELDDALGLSDLAGDELADKRTGRNGRHALVGLLRQSVFGSARWLRERERCRAATPRFGDALDRRLQNGERSCHIIKSECDQW